MRYEWTPALITGVEDIDEQHLTIFALANALAAAVEHGADEDDLEDAVYGLTDYVVEHFTDEQDLMRRADFPQRIAHEMLHQQLSEQVVHLAAQLFNEDDVSPTQLSDLVAFWLTNHIAGHDRELADWIREHPQT